MKICFNFLLLVFVAAGCNSAGAPEEKPVAAEEQQSAEPELPEQSQLSNQPPGDTVPYNIQIDSVIHLSFGKGNNSVSVTGHLDKSGEPVICMLPVGPGRELSASLTPANKDVVIRFSHIHLPDGTTDGPFGANLKYKLVDEGLYKIYIGPNMMAGKAASTDFTLNVRVD